MTAKRSRLLLLSVAFCPILFLSAGAQEPPPETLKTTTRMVVLDVIATDKQGHPVRDLKAEDFAVTEKGIPQKISVFERYSPANSQRRQLDQNILSNQIALQATSEGQGVTIILIDGLNTPIQNQGYVKEEILKYLAKQYQTGSGSAVLALTTELRVLQDFTTDPALLRRALEKYQAKEAPVYTRERTPGGTPPGVDFLAGTGAYDRIVANVQFFANEQVSRALAERIQITMAAMRAIARATAGIQARKNLIWVSAAFPITFDPENPGRLGFSESYAEQFKLTEAILTQARVAVYPVDAVGLSGKLMGDAANPGQTLVGRMGGYSDMARADDKVDSYSLGSKMAMEELATQTGGRAFYNRNDIDNSVAIASAEGAEAYVIGYYPDDKQFDNKFRKVQVKVSRPDVKVRHRPGYFAVDLSRPTIKAKDPAKARQEELAVLLSDPFPATALGIDAQVQQPPPGSKEAKVRVIVHGKDLTYTPQASGEGQQIDVDLIAAAYRDGAMVANAGRSQAAVFTPAQVAQLMLRGPLFEFPLSLAPGDYLLKVAVRDAASGKVGMVRGMIHIGPTATTPEK